jgi:phytoene dehydrogenase-like protein
MRRVKGGMGALSEALCRLVAEKGGEVRLETPVRRILVEGGRATGVELRDEMAERIVDRLSEFLPDLRECIVERAVFSSDHFAAMHGATNGDFTHGLIHPEQMIGGRLLVPGSAHATPIPGLYLCGASCHPGPGVTFLPGYGAAYEVAEALASAQRWRAGKAATLQRKTRPRALRSRLRARRAQAGWS